MPRGTAPQRGARRAADRSAADVLLACARLPVDNDLIRSRMERADVSTVERAAFHHRIAPLAHVRLRDALGASTPALLAGHQEQVFQHLRTLAAIRWLVDAMAAESVDWLVVKGPVLSAIYERPDLRMYSDLDVLVEPRQLGAALAVLDAAGAELVDRNWTMILRDMRGEISYTLPGRTALDLHWTLVNERRIRAAFSLPITRMARRAVRARLDQSEVLTLDPIDSLIHVCLHGVLSGGHRLLWTIDVDRIIRAGSEPDWDMLVERCKTAGAALVVAVALDRAHRLLSAPVPKSVLAALAPVVGWRAVVTAGDRARPPELSFRAGSSGRLIAESTRANSFASAGSALLHARLWVRHRRRPVAPTGDLSADSGSAHDRAEFLRLVGASVLAD